MVDFHISRQATVNGARATVVGGVLGVGGVRGIQPEHVGKVIIPEGHHQHDTLDRDRSTSAM